MLRFVLLGAVCDIPSLHIDNANYTITGNLFNDYVTYRCLEGSIHTSGDLYRRCNHLGNWTGTRPTCSEFTILNPTHTKVSCLLGRKLMTLKKTQTISQQKLIISFIYIVMQQNIFELKNTLLCTCR